VQQYSAKFIAQGCASWFARRDYIDAAPAQVLRQLAKLGALACAIKTFKSNKFAALLSGAQLISSYTRLIYQC